MRLAISQLFLDLVEMILAAKWVDYPEIRGYRGDLDVERTTNSPRTLRWLL